MVLWLLGTGRGTRVLQQHCMPIEGDKRALGSSGAAGGTLVGRDEVLDKKISLSELHVREALPRL